MNSEDKRNIWKASWQKCFDGPESNEAREILRTGLHETVEEVSNVAEYVIQELQSMEIPKQTSTAADIQKSLDSMTLEELQMHVKSNMVKLDHEIGSWKVNRQHGLKKAARNIEEFAETFDAFLAGFSGIVEVVQLVDSQYAGAASSVLFILFATAKAKTGNDRAIISSMQLLAHRLPDLEIYYQIYADGDLAKMLSKAYSDVISFSRKATVYFQGHGFTRFTKGITQPKAFGNLERGMAQNFEEIRIRCDALVSRRIFDLSKENAELMKQVKELNKEIQDLHKRKDEEAAYAFRRSLLHQDQSDPMPKSKRKSELEKYNTFLKLVSSEDNNYLTVMTQEWLQHTLEYRQWEDANASILVLYGRNHIDRRAIQSWLSQAAVEYTLGHMSRSTDSTVAHVIGKKDNLQDALTSIADQLVEQEPQVLRRASAQDNILFQAHDPKLASKGHMMADIISRCSRPVYIFIDRLDLCYGKETWPVMKLLMDLVADTPARLKILLVFSVEFWNIDTRMDLVASEFTESKKLILLRRDQGELDDF